MRVFLILFIFSIYLTNLHTFARAKKGFNPARIPGIEVPKKEYPILTAYARGSQNYQCRKVGDTYQWVFIGPEAVLFDYSGLQIGVHLLGPSWKHVDNSFVIGKLVSKIEETGNIPQLLLSATKNSTHGILSKVTSIQRINTKGGNPPSMELANKKHLGKIVKVPYVATYIFYRSKH